MTPGMVMMSEMPWTPWRRTSSAMRKLSKKPVSLATCEEFFVGDDDDGVDGVEQLLQAALGLHAAALALKAEGAGDDGDGERAHFAGERGDDRRGAGAGAAAEAGR